LACFGVNSLIGLSSVSFPASVAVLVLLFVGLSLIELILGDRKTRALVKFIDIPVSLCPGYSQCCTFLMGNYRLDLPLDI